ncbi:hypothetical protein CEUSTIGMA_g7463.t1 [Chlamydomonas eustigma]|uniref:Uncharacterized protein n=1 Tax=Chlamydomonas eustigma TaxID=1157962 RepID=A0A250XAD8_9CHLO|nr:hypothetical protein CEUSTIGMA_g7463.t1 [Chlamydomonas eustigma]|eukprot:GAX80024.1 hypothetical protein CEUSTIGMA_g7463.t1 [Chlamydomonas eustigma]
MSSSLRYLVQQCPKVTRGFSTSNAASGEIKKHSHESITLGDGHHGFRPGYHYDYEHGPHYLEPRKIPNFMLKWNIGLKAMFAVGIGVPLFAVWWQQSKLRG